MSDQIRISAKNLGALALKGCNMEVIAILRVVIVPLFLVYFSGCSTVGQIPPHDKKENAPLRVAELIDWSQGKTFREVIEYAGQPGAVDIKNNSMVIQYCSTGVFTDKYVQLFLYKKRVVGSYQTNASIAEGWCSQIFPSPQWLNAPAVILDDIGLSIK